MYAYPSEYVEQAVLNDGTQVEIRPIRPDDAPRLQQGFRMLSPQTIYLRFLQTAKELSDKQANFLAGVDYEQRMALVGVIQEEDEERLAAVARYDVLPDRPGLAEAAIVVRDDYQHRGLGTQIMLKLVRYACIHGVQAFVAAIHTNNQGIMGFIHKSGLPVTRKLLEPGIWEVRVEISPLV